MADIMTTFDSNISEESELLGPTDRIRAHLMETLTTICQLGPGS